MSIFSINTISAVRMKWEVSKLYLLASDLNWSLIHFLFLFVNIHVLICSVHCQVRVSQAGTQVHLLIEILMMWPWLLLAFPASMILVSKYLVFIRKLVKTLNLNLKDKILNVYIFPFVWNDIECVQVWDVVLVVDTGWGWHHPGVWAVAGKWVAVIWAQFGHHSASAQPRQ